MPGNVPAFKKLSVNTTGIQILRVLKGIHSNSFTYTSLDKLVIV